MCALVVGVLAIIALTIYIGITKFSVVNQGFYTTDSAEYQAAVADRIQPLGQVYLTRDSINAETPQVMAAEPADPVATVLSGPQVYNEACNICHGAGIGGAPIISDPSLWTTRIGQGNDTLYQHALEGYTGEFGYMPPKGARMDLSDDDVKGAVDYMIETAIN
jgi:cytochrome c5